MGKESAIPEEPGNGVEMAQGLVKEEVAKMQTMESNATTGHEKSDMWDRFLDAYSEYIDDPSIGAAMSLKLWGQRLEEIDQSFSLQAFEARLCGVHLQPIAIDADR